jgi:plasmid stabilization system protein ParE
MTGIRWTEPANADFLGIIEWIRNDNSPAVAASIGRRILSSIERLGDFPHMGRPGRSPGTRELVIARLPYVVVYSVEAAVTHSSPPQIAILRVLHGAMLWPPESDRND